MYNTPSVVTPRPEDESRGQTAGPQVGVSSEVDVISYYAGRKIPKGKWELGAQMNATLLAIPYRRILLVKVRLDYSRQIELDVGTRGRAQFQVLFRN